MHEFANNSKPFSSYSMNIGDLCSKYKIPDDKWKHAMNMLVRVLLLKDLFPKCDGQESDPVLKIMQKLDLKDIDVKGNIYNTVSFLFK